MFARKASRDKIKPPTPSCVRNHLSGRSHGSRRTTSRICGIVQIACLRARDTLLRVFEHAGILFSATESNLNINELILEMPNDGAA